MIRNFNNLTVNQKINIKGNLLKIAEMKNENCSIFKRIRNTKWDESMEFMTEMLQLKTYSDRYKPEFDHARYRQL